MILYHVITTYHLLNAIVHSKTHTDKSILVCFSGLKNKVNDFNKLKEFFDDVKCLDINYRFTHSAVDTKKYFEDNLGAFENFDSIYCWGAQYSLGVSLTENNISFVFCEEGCGILSRPYILMDIEKKLISKSRFCDLIDGLGLYDGENDNFKFKLCNLKAQKRDFNCTGNIIDFDVIDNLKKFSLADRNCIFEFFDISTRINTNHNTVLLLTQSFNSLNILDFDKHILIYQLLIDYFFYGMYLVIKPHPDDLSYYEYLFGEAKVIREKFPSEFIPFVFEVQPSMIATIGSTATFSLRGHYKNIFELDSRYEKDFLYTHKYYASVCVAKVLNRDISYISANEVLLQKLADTFAMNNSVSKNLSETSGKSNVLIVDDITDQCEVGREEFINLLENINDDICVVLINSKRDYCWYDYYHRELWNDIVPIVLKKEVHKPQSEDFYADTEDEVIYVYSKNKELLNMVREMEIEKELLHTGITVRKEIMTSEQERIKMLEGILEATEKRLLYYINKEKEQ